ncbi:uncharacterized protein SPAPADRAFT_62337 [Spathaspora passalidarum NRRL Y-27907]|uniref:Uncharacterized protein n=1 Tax=Spathaspora passalidarum (strain NRRL Y-27907 / 11-Y1) TaxID=619300 RepID=G3ARD3_SPAPN|nr:uncharacterized protein SPAPADRAFT_62337 [Spathaspora passalidarum NRRL Y-27907]EGW31740.1 hypothetical protein SPAPADRAFT_62337 [Spathaspora passalidarum NRRL Y-27907]
MPPRKTKSNLDIFEKINADTEDEILDEYSELLGDDDDLHLKELPELLQNLRIPAIFTDDIVESVEYYYNFIRNRDVSIDPSNIKQSMSFQLIKAYTITNAIRAPSDIIDIIDIDKLLFNVNRLVKFRNNYKHIRESWRLFVSDSSNIEHYKLALPDLKQVKSNLNLDNDPETRKPISESFLIDMLGCCSHDSNGNLLNYMTKEGACVTIKDFAEILGNLGELD